MDKAGAAARSDDPGFAVGRKLRAGLLHAADDTAERMWDALREAVAET